MTVGSNKLYFGYDASGTPMRITYNGTVYYYVTNLQGDVIAILNSSGTAVVQYTYDAWGNPVSTTGSMVSTLGATNPLRYRGYVYDQETGLYYLQSRYYNPKTGRFLNADALTSTGQGTLGNNMFAYCNNSSIDSYDPDGYDREPTDFLNRCLSGGVGADLATAGLGAMLWGLAVSAFDATVSFTKSVGDSITQTAKKTSDRYLSRSHYVYHLTDSNGTVQYVGRTQHLLSRKNAHKNSKYRGHLKFDRVTPALTYYEARAVEQAGMLYHHTLNTSKKMHNQINGIAPKYWDSYKTIARGIVGYLDNQISNEGLWWAEG